MSDIFISYSRKDIAFARILNDLIQARGLESWIDWKDIPPTADWLEEVFQAIEGADTFVFVVSMASVSSETCSKELSHAIENHKRIVPIVVEDIEPKETPTEISVLTGFSSAKVKMTIRNHLTPY